VRGHISLTRVHARALAGKVTDCRLCLNDQRRPYSAGWHGGSFDLMEYQTKDTLVLGETVRLYSPDGWRWFSDLSQLAKWKKQQALLDNDFSWKKTHRKRVPSK
jgi:hypothetical protein